MKNQFLNSLWLILLCSYVGRVDAQNTTYFPQSTPEAEGVSSSAILSFIDKVESEIDAVHSVMILRHGKLITQGWWAPYGPESPHIMHSLSKSFTSTAIGLAVDEKLLSLTDLVISFFPEETPEEPSRQLQQMRIVDLLTMNTGHIKEPRPRGGDDNWVKTFLHAKVELMPGTHFKYNSAATYMLSAILQKVTGERLVDYLDKRLFQPLKIKKPEWDTCPRGINTGGWGLHIVTEDIAKLGQLYLQKGKWEGRQLLSEEWIAMATSKQVSNGSNPDNDWTQGYGFQFWRCRHNCYRGDGAMGQFCIVMPEQDAVVAITSGVYDMGAVMQLVWDELLPAMEKEALPASDAYGHLKEKLANLALKPVAGTDRGDLASKLNNREFTMEENELGVKAVSFQLQGDQHQLAVDMEHGRETVAIGSGKYIKGNLVQHLPYTNSASKAIAASGAWITPEEYQLRIYLYETPARITYTFRFEESGLKWDSKLEHELFGPRTQESMSGRVK